MAAPAPAIKPVKPALAKAAKLAKAKTPTKATIKKRLPKHTKLHKIVKRVVPKKVVVQ